MEAMRSFFQTNLKEMQLACLEYLKTRFMPLMKINMSTIAAYMGKPALLKMALESGYPQIVTLNGKTLLDYSVSKSDMPSVNILMDDLNQRHVDFIHQHDLINVIQRFQPKYKDIIEKCFKHPAHFHAECRDYQINGITGYIEKPVIIQSERFIITKQMVESVVDFESPKKKIISVKTFLSRFDIELGTTENIKGLAVFLKAPQEFKETSVSVLVDYMFQENWWRIFNTNWPGIVQFLMLLLYCLWDVPFLLSLITMIEMLRLLFRTIQKAMARPYGLNTTTSLIHWLIQLTATICAIKISLGD